MATATKPGTDVQQFGMNVDDLAGSDQLNAISSYDDALVLLGLDGLGADEISSFLEWDTNPYQVVEKKELEGKPLLIVQWRFVDGTFGEYVVCHAIARLGNGTDWQVLFTDGSVGIARQLNELTNKRLADIDSAATEKEKAKLPRPQQGAFVRGGLAASNYEVEGPDGKMIPATTYYLSNSAKAA